MDLTKFSEYGLIGLMIMAIIGLLFIIIKWVLKEHHDLMAQQAEERKCWHETIMNLSDNINKTKDSIIEHDRRADERGKFVREEHKQMIETLGRINGYKHE